MFTSSQSIQFFYFVKKKLIYRVNSIKMVPLAIRHIQINCWNSVNLHWYDFDRNNKYALWLFKIFSVIKKNVATVILLYIPRIHGPNGYFKPYLYVAVLCYLTQNEFLIKINFYAIHLSWENFMTMILMWKNKTDTFC